MTSEDPDFSSDAEGSREPASEPARAPELKKRLPKGKKRAVRPDVDTTRGRSTPLTLEQRMAELERMNRDLITKNRILQRALRATTAGSEVSEGVAGEEVAGRTSMASFRNKTWEKFATQVLRLPTLVLKYGRGKTREMVAVGLLADLDTLALGRPWNKREARMRAAIEHIITDRGKLNVLMGRDSAGRGMRTVFLQQVARLYYLPSVARLFEKSAENYMNPELFGGQG